MSSEVHTCADCRLAGYKARTYIAKNLQCRCTAIRNAVKIYNEAALALDPPHETLNCTTALHYSFLEKFALLQDTHKDIQKKPWAWPAVRKLMRLAQHLLHAREEVKNANCEVRCMHTSICNEENLFLEDLKNDRTPLFGVVEDFCRRRHTYNARNIAYMQAMYPLLRQSHPWQSEGCLPPLATTTTSVSGPCG